MDNGNDNVFKEEIPHTLVKDISSGTIYGDGFKNGTRSMYISKSSELKRISSIQIPLLETGFVNLSGLEDKTNLQNREEKGQTKNFDQELPYWPGPTSGITG